MYPDWDEVKLGRKELLSMEEDLSNMQLGNVG